MLTTVFGKKREQARFFTNQMELYLAQLREKQDLDEAGIQEVSAMLLDESLDHEAKADLLAALSEKGETASEIAGFAQEFLKRAVDPGLDGSAVGKPLLDVCGTGGDKLNTFNVSTTCVFVLAAAGIGVVKHGNRGITSKSGGADVLEALGIRIDLSPEDFCRCVAEVGAGFLFAPMYHPAFKAVVPVRQLLATRGQRTIFNLLGPLLNPVQPDFQVIGVFDENVGEDFAEILSQLGRTRAWAVHGKTEDGAGMDEVSNLGNTSVWETSPEGCSEFTISPAALGITPSLTRELEGGDAKVNADILTGILSGTMRGAKRDIVTLNSAAGLVVSGKAASIEEGIQKAEECIDSGAAKAILETWQAFS